LVNFANCFSGTRARVDYEELRALAPAERFQAAIAEAKRHGTLPAATPEEYIHRIVNVGAANVRAIQGFEPRPLAASVHLFFPTVEGGLAQIAGRPWDESGDHGWGSEVGQALELHKVSGDHFTMMVGEGAAQIARQLQLMLAAEFAARK
jgi:thioesterase domain-containing protein